MVLSLTLVAGPFNLCVIAVDGFDSFFLIGSMLDRQGFLCVSWVVHVFEQQRIFLEKA